MLQNIGHAQNKTHVIDGRNFTTLEAYEEISRVMIPQAEWGFLKGDIQNYRVRDSVMTKLSGSWRGDYCAVIQQLELQWHQKNSNWLEKAGPLFLGAIHLGLC